MGPLRYLPNKLPSLSRDPMIDYYDVSFRACRFKITYDTYECIITSLNEDEMSLEDIKKFVIFAKR